MEILNKPDYARSIKLEHLVTRRDWFYAKMHGNVRGGTESENRMKYLRLMGEEKTRPGQISASSREGSRTSSNFIPVGCCYIRASDPLGL